MIRIVSAILAVLAVASTSAFAADSVAPVELRLTAIGESINRADNILFYVALASRAPTTAEAQAANQTKIAALTDALAARGIDRKAVNTLPAQAQIGFIGNERYGDFGDAFEGSQFSPAAASVNRKSASATLKIQLSTPDMARIARTVIETHDANLQILPIYKLKDDRAAREAAIADGLLRVRREAESYATSLNMRIDRIASISNVGEIPLGGTGMDSVGSMMAEQLDVERINVTTRVPIWVTFILAQR